jgi:cytochrome c-type biogenesis protein CcmF
MVLGFAGEGFKKEEQALLNVGEQVTVGRFTIKHDALRVTSDSQKQMITGHVSVFEGGKQIDAMTPAKWYFRKHEQEPTTEVAIRRAPAEDVYIVLAGFDIASQSATYTVTVNPLVNWIWIGFAIMALGTAIAVLPDSVFAFAVAKLPAGAVTSGLMLLLMLLPSSGFAQSSFVPKSSLRKQVESEVMCTCGCRVAINTCPMGPSCHGLQALNPKIDGFIGKGMNREQILDALVADHGGEDILLAPLDKGFNRLAWMFPYAVGVLGAGAIAFAAKRWARHEVHDLKPAVADPALNGRLDDELRDLD